MTTPHVGAGRAAHSERETWLRAVVGIGQLTLGTWLLVAWLLGAPRGVVAVLIVASLGLVLTSRLRWRGR